MKTKVFTSQLLVLFLISTLIYSQKDNLVKDKISNIKGTVNKVVFSTSEGNVVFEGEEAEELTKMLKAKKMKKHIEWISDDYENIDFDLDFDIDSDSNRVMVFKSDKGGKHIIKKLKGDDNVMIFKHGDNDDFDILEDGKTVKVEVEDENGEKKVTVITKEDGKEKVEVFEGKEADEYLEKMNEDGNMTIDFIGDSDDLIWVSEDGDITKIEKDVKVELENGKKKVTVTTIEDGEKKVEVYEGDDADKFFEDKNGENIQVKVKKLKDGKHKKIIIKELEKESNEEKE